MKETSIIKYDDDDDDGDRRFFHKSVKETSIIEYDDDDSIVRGVSGVSEVTGVS